MKVSVVLLAYNHESFIDDALNGVLMQETDFAFEILVGEDFSSDRTREILLAYKERYPDKIKLLLHDKNYGPAKNFRETLRLAQGNYVAFLDGDDYWTSPRKLQTQVDFLDRHPDCSMCFHGVQKSDPDGTVELHPVKRQKRFYELEDIISRNPIPACSPMCRGEIVSRYNWKYPDDVVGDRLLYIWNAQFGKIGYIDQIMGVYRVHEEGLFRALEMTKRIQWAINTLNFVSNKIDPKYRKTIKRALARRYLTNAVYYSQKGHFVSAWTSLRSFIRETIASFRC